MSDREISLVGAGLVGSLLAIFLAKRGFQVSVYERRPDLRQTDISAGKSINLALANRGIFPLDQVGLMDQVQKIMLPMRGRMLHDEQGQTSFQAYGQKEHEVIYSISRGQLNALLLDAAEQTGRVKLFFNHRCQKVDFAKNQLEFFDGAKGETKLISFEQVIGSDGSGSAIRKAILEQACEQNSEEPLGHSYKELCMPASADGRFAMEADALHIWPRGEYMQIALPNLDGSFTVTLFMPNKGEVSFEGIDSASKLRAFYEANFSDSLPLLPSLADDYFNNPTGSLMTVRCKPWSYQNKALLLGDAAHAIVPFHGQGMNCGFEDCVGLMECMDASDSWDEVFKSFEHLRKPNSDAIADLAIANYVEMRNTVRDPKFHLKKQLAFQLEGLYPELFIPQYSMVMFHRMPYARAQQIGRVQEQILNRCVEGVDGPDNLDLSLARRLVEENRSSLN
ncbi:MAG: FAD-dependent monooxygenase [Oligoflexales bacterium]|nr:FAD-dependent monooxygenase [Oligoflexales bacterium]